MNLVLVTREEADQRSLMHYRTKGSKNGERRYQNEDGSLTPLGYMHYAAMYGWGKHTAKTPVEISEFKAKQAELKAEQARTKAEKAKEREQKLNRSEKEIKADLNKKIQQINDKNRQAKIGKEINRITDKEFNGDKITEADLAKLKQLTGLDDLGNNEKKELLRASGKDFDGDRANSNDRSRPVVGIDEKGKEVDVTPKRLSLGDQTKLAIVDQSQLQEQKEQIKKARDMSDNELQQAINRLQKEKQYSELLNERSNREKGPVRAMASKLLQDAAQDLARKALGVAVDKIIDKAKEKAAFKLGDYKDVDPYSLPSDKLKAVAEAFNNAANIARNRNVINNGGQDPNQGGNNQNNQNNNKGSNNQNDQPKKDSANTSGNQQTNNETQSVSKNQRKKMRAMANSGQSAAEIAKQLGVSESTVRQYAGEQLKDRTEQSQNAAASTPEATQTSSSAQKVDRTEQNRSYMSAASVNRKQLAKNLDTTTRNVKRAEKFLDTFSKEAKLEADEKAKQERLKQFSDWVNGAEWAKEKVRIQTENAKEEAERRESERQKKLRAQARMFGYRW